MIQIYKKTYPENDDEMINLIYTIDENFNGITHLEVSSDGLSYV